MSFLTNTKDLITKLASYFVVYDFRCPGCHHDNIGNTDKILSERINKHGYPDKNRVIWLPSQPEIKCSKLAIETLEQGVKYVQS